MSTESSSRIRTTDVLIIGGGAAGLALALRIADSAKVTILSKSSLKLGSTYYAQGGIAAVLDSQDSLASHVDDTLVAGAGLCHREIVEYVVGRARESIEWLVGQGLAFSRDEESEASSVAGGYHLTKEGGHSHRRVIHAADATGKAVFETLASRVLNHPNISFVTNSVAIDLLTTSKLGRAGQRCLGAYVLHEDSGMISTLGARFTVLA
ncbi:MAG: FAD-dependent oxidoreductase, partial [Gammaproteobacteria bacterium]